VVQSVLSVARSELLVERSAVQ
jgi:hypothetical protein